MVVSGRVLRNRYLVGVLKNRSGLLFRGRAVTLRRDSNHSRRIGLLLQVKCQRTKDLDREKGEWKLAKPYRFSRAWRLRRGCLLRKQRSGSPNMVRTNLRRHDAEL